MITNSESGTNIHEIADGIYRINTPVGLPGAGQFNFNQYLVVDDEPLLFHSGLRKLFPWVREAIAAVMPVEKPSMRLPEAGRRSTARIREARRSRSFPSSGRMSMGSL